MGLGPVFGGVSPTAFKRETQTTSRQRKQNSTKYESDSKLQKSKSEHGAQSVGPDGMRPSPRRTRTREDRNRAPWSCTKKLPSDGRVGGRSAEEVGERRRPDHLKKRRSAGRVPAFDGPRRSLLGRKLRRPRSPRACAPRAPSTHPGPGYHRNHGPAFATGTTCQTWPKIVPGPVPGVPQKRRGTQAPQLRVIVVRRYPVPVGAICQVRPKSVPGQAGLGPESPALASRDPLAIMTTCPPASLVVRNESRGARLGGGVNASKVGGQKGIGEGGQSRGLGQQQEGLWSKRMDPRVRNPRVPRALPRHAGPPNHRDRGPAFPGPRWNHLPNSGQVCAGPGSQGPGPRARELRPGTREPHHDHALRHRRRPERMSGGPAW